MGLGLALQGSKGLAAFGVCLLVLFVFNRKVDTVVQSGQNCVCAHACSWAVRWPPTCSQRCTEDVLLLPRTPFLLGPVLFPSLDPQETPSLQNSPVL